MNSVYLVTYQRGETLYVTQVSNPDLGDGLASPDSPVALSGTVGNLAALANGLLVTAPPASASALPPEVGAVVERLTTSGMVRVRGAGLLPSWPPPARFTPNDGFGGALVYNEQSGAWAELVNRGGALDQINGGRWDPGWIVRTADFDANDLTDLFFYNPTSGYFFKALNDSTGNFNFFGYAWSPGWVPTIVDIDGDGRSDVFLYNPVTGMWFTCLSWDLGGTDPTLFGDFTYRSYGWWAPGWQIVPLASAVKEIGLPYTSTSLLLYNPTTGAYAVAKQRPPCIPCGESYYSIQWDLSTTGLWAPGWKIYPADFNGDNRMDLFLYNPDNGMWFVVLNTDSGFTYQGGYWDPGWTIVPTDFNADLRADLFLYNTRTGMWFVVLTNADGSFTYYSGFWDPGWQVTATDFNQDGLSDLLLYNATSGMYFQVISTDTPGAFQYFSGFWDPRWTVLANLPSETYYKR